MDASISDNTNTERLVKPSPTARPLGPRLTLLEALDGDTVQSALEAVRKAKPSADAPLVQIYGKPARGHRRALLIDADVDRFEDATQAADAAPRPVAFMFPGLGDQYVDMGRALYDALPVFSAEVDRCAAILQPVLGVDIRELLYPPRPGAEGALASPSQGLDLRMMLRRASTAPRVETPLNRTVFAHPALFVIEYALAAQLRAWGIEPELMIGYSLGEYVAACLAGVLSLEDSLTLVARRAQLVERLPAGAMLAVAMPEAEIGSLLGKHLSLSAINRPDMCVVGGPPEEIEALEKELSARGAAARRVQSSHAFHTPAMRPIAEELTKLVASYDLRPPRVPYVSNVTGALIDASEATSAEYWTTHLCSPVRFFDGVRTLAAVSERVLIEVGPGRTLSSMATFSGVSGTKNKGKRLVMGSMRHPFDRQSDLAVLLQVVRKLWLSFARVDWERFQSEPLPSGVSEAPAHAPVVADAAVPAEAADTEQTLVGIWEKLLPGVEITAESSFFESGGNSLIATRLALRLSRVFGVKLPLASLYEAATLSAMAGAIDAARGENTASSSPRAAGKPTKRTSSWTPPDIRYVLPNGLAISHLNEGETKHFYEDIFDHRTYAKNGITIPEGGTVFDVGGNIGLFTLFVHTERPGTRVFTFEPAPPLFALVEANAARHGVNIRAFNCGLSDAERQADFTFYPRSTGMSSFHADEVEEKHNLRTIIDNQRKQCIPGAAEIELTDELLDLRLEPIRFTATLRRLSDVMREQNVEQIDLMKVDVQRCELEVLQGIDDADWPKIRQIVLEAHDIDGRVDTVCSLLQSKGFSVKAEQDPLYVGTNIHNIYASRDRVVA